MVLHKTINTSMLTAIFQINLCKSVILFGDKWQRFFTGRMPFLPPNNPTATALLSLHQLCTHFICSPIHLRTIEQLRLPITAENIIIFNKNEGTMATKIINAASTLSDCVSCNIINPTHHCHFTANTQDNTC